MAEYPADPNPQPPMLKIGLTPAADAAAKTSVITDIPCSEMLTL